MSIVPVGADDSGGGDDFSDPAVNKCQQIQPRNELYGQLLTSSQPVYDP